jgi:hypothetical protein
MWATDTPLPAAVLPTDQYLKVFVEPQTDIEFTREEIEQIIGGSAAEIFGIS